MSEVRLIDANALIKDVLDLQNCYNGFSDTYDKACIIGVINEQPTIDPVRWIPVTERLPEKSGHYLITVVSDVTDGEPTVFTDDYFFHGWDDWEEDVVAWAVKPEPWRGEKKE